MKKLGLILYSILAFIFSLTLATNLFAYLLHYAQVLGSPHFGKWYEPFHILYWYLTVRAPGNQYRISFIAFLVCFSALGFLGFRIYTKLKLNLLGIYGNSRWAKTRELSRMVACTDKVVILGQTQQAHYREIETYVNEEKQRQFRMLRPGQVLFSDDPSHVLVIAPTRWGKGISCVCTTLLCWSHSAIVYDIKGELFEITSGWRRAFSHILRFDPSGYDSVHFNPLWEIQRNTFNDVSQAQNIAELLCNPNGDDLKPDHWRESAAQILVGAILYVLYSDDEHDKSLHGVYHLLNDPNKPMEDVLNQMLTLEHSAVQESARGMLNKAPNERSGVLSTAVRFLALYQDPIVAANTAYSDFSIKDLTAQEHPCTLYLCINPKDAARLKPLTRLLLSLIATTLTSGFHTNKNRL